MYQVWRAEIFLPSCYVAKKQQLPTCILQTIGIHLTPGKSYINLTGATGTSPNMLVQRCESLRASTVLRNPKAIRKLVVFTGGGVEKYHFLSL